LYSLLNSAVYLYHLGIHWIGLHPITTRRGENKPLKSNNTKTNHSEKHIKNQPKPPVASPIAIEKKGAKIM
jgi:hypothetical protein